MNHIKKIEPIQILSLGWAYNSKKSSITKVFRKNQKQEFESVLKEKIKNIWIRENNWVKWNKKE